jgi:hypothetical protein
MCTHAGLSSKNTVRPPAFISAQNLRDDFLAYVMYQKEKRFFPKNEKARKERNLKS